ncbi:MAG TPA: hypothetical protein VLT47_03255 [Anaeromyxobacteraceae bacterium]|nr:hypothetical protein [Anaeromyxobacteraceae bacterium]
MGKVGTPAPTPPSRRAAGSSKPAEPPGSLVGTLELELVAALEERRMAEEPRDRIAAAKLVAQLVAALDRLRPDPAPTREELEAKLRPRAEDVLGKIRNGCLAVTRREAETGKCHRCGQGMPPETVLRRRIEAGMADPSPMH